MFTLIEFKDSEDEGLLLEQILARLCLWSSNFCCGLCKSQASDVVFGATLGWVVGHTIAGKHKKLEIAGFELLPYVAGINDLSMGVSLVKQF